MFHKFNASLFAKKIGSYEHSSFNSKKNSNRVSFSRGRKRDSKKSSNIGLKTSQNNDHFENMTKFLDTVPSFPANIMNTFSSKNNQNLDDNNGIDLHSSFDPRTDIKSDVITKAKSHHANYIYKNFK